MSAKPSLYRLRRRDVAIVVSLGLGQVACVVAFLLFLIAVVDSMTPETVGSAAAQARRLAWSETLGLAVTALVYGVLRAKEFSIAERIGYAIVRDLRMRMYRHLQGMTGRQLQHRARGGLLLRFIGDLSMLRMWISRGLLGGIVAALVVVGTVLALMILNLYIGLSVLTVLCAGAAASLTNGRRMRSATRTMRRRRSLVTGNIDEQINALSVVQVFGRTRGEYARLSRQNASLTDALGRMADLRGRLRGVSSAVGLLSVVAVLAIGLVEVTRGAASVGLVVAAMTVTRQLNGPVRNLGLAHDYWHRAQVSSQKVQDFLASSSRDSTEVSQRLRVRKGVVELRDVSVSGALESVSVQAERGRCIAITGPMGSGKSTLLGLVARAVEPDSGTVLVDGQDIACVAPDSLHRYLGVVGPDLPLMRGSVRRNLTYRFPQATPDEVRRVVAASGLGDILETLTDGLDTWVTEGGRNLSSSQRQHIAFARALMGNPPVLLLDEPTASLDEHGKAAFRRMLGRHQGTVLMTTHEPDDLALADEVWVLEGGRVAEVLSGDEFDVRRWRNRAGGGGWHSPAAC